MFSTTVLLPLTLLFIATGQIVAKDLPVYQLPPYVKKACARNDPKLNQCVVEVGNAALKSVVKGDAKYRIPVLNPMHIKELIIRQGTKQVGLKLICKDCNLLGLENIVFVKSDLNFATHHHRWDFTLDKMKVVGKYNVSGKILLLPINGAGDAEFNFEKLKFTFTFDTVFEERNNGRKYVKLVNGSFPLVAEHMTMKLDNLFNGDKLLGSNMNTFLNDNWREILKDIKPALNEALATLVISLLNNMADLIPLENMFPEK